MFMFLKLLAVGLFLIASSEFIENRGHAKFFRSVPQNITNSTFPVTLKTASKSDTIFVKCPGKNYKHRKKADDFKPSDQMDNSILKITNEGGVCDWIPLMKNQDNLASIECGKIFFYSENINVGLQSEIWKFNLKWEDNKDYSNLKKLENMTDSFPLKKANCSRTQGETIVLAKERNGTLLEVVPDKEYKAFTKQRFYYFERPNVTDTAEIKEPCTILVAYDDCPTIKLLGYESAPRLPSGEIFIGMEKPDGTFNVTLVLRNSPDFYKGEEVTFSRIKLLENNKKEIIEDSFKIITSHFDINGYNIVKLTYSCLNSTNVFVNVSESFYFGPQNDNHIIDKGTVHYDHKQNIIKPNCSLEFTTIGYLKEIVYKNENIDVILLRKNIKQDERFNLTDKYIYLTGAKENRTALKCLYKTPRGNISILATYVTEVKKIININDVDNLKKALEESKKSWFEKLVDNHGKPIAYTIVSATLFAIILVALVILFCLYYFLIGPWIKVKRLQKKYPNIFEFWNGIANESFGTFCEAINSQDYISSIVKNRVVTKNVEGDEIIDAGIHDLFHESLVKCYSKVIKEKIQAHYVYNDSKKRKFILSDGPTKATEDYFWKMIYEEDIGAIVAIIYDKGTDSNFDMNHKIYWPNASILYGDIKVTLEERIKTNLISVSVMKFKISDKSGVAKEVIIYHSKNWNEHEIPQSELQIINLYNEVSTLSEGKNILVHTSQGTGSRVYMFVYFACIFDAMKTNSEITNPMNIVKEIREKRFGGNIAIFEYAYVIKALITMFFNNKLLADRSGRHLEFIKKYDDYMYNFLARESKMDGNHKGFLTFANIVDSGKIREFKSIFNSVGKLSHEDILKSCQRFFKVKQDKSLANKIRYSTILCLDSSSVPIYGKSKDDLTGFIHANAFKYRIKNDGERKLMLFQAPLKNTIDDTIDMIFRHKISVIVMLVKPEEAPPFDTKWIQYLPEPGKTDTRNLYTVTNLSHKEINENLIIEGEYIINTLNDGQFRFKVLQYCGWLDKNIPINHETFYTLYKEVMTYENGNYIGIHCIGGIGRTGIMAFIIYLIDTINLYPNFDPLARLKTLREHRYKAVQTFNQFLFALVVVFTNFKDLIDEVDPEIYTRFVKLSKESFIKGKKKTDKQEQIVRLSYDK